MRCLASIQMMLAIEMATMPEKSNGVIEPAQPTRAGFTAFRFRVLRDPRRLLKTITLAAPVFLLWDAFAIANSHWFFSEELTLSIYGPLGIPIAGILTLEGVTNFLPTVRSWIARLRKVKA